MRGDGALAHDQNLLQFGHGELLTAEEQQNAEAVGVGYYAEDFHNGGHSWQLTARGDSDTYQHITIGRYKEVQNGKFNAGSDGFGIQGSRFVFGLSLIHI